MVIILALCACQQYTRDLVFSVTRERWHIDECNLTDSVVPLYRDCPQASLLTPRVAKTLGGLNWIAPGSPVWGYCNNGRVVACAEALVRSERAASIGQIFADEEYRGRGFARTLVRHVSEALVRQGFDLVYIVAEENAPSVRLAHSLGFSVETHLGCLS